MLQSLAIIKNALVLLAVLLLSSISHASAVIATPSHEMNGNNHSAGESNPCATLCRSGLVNRDTVVILHQDDDGDDELAAPPYFLSQSGYSTGQLEKQRLYASAVKPPPKVPAYILYGVFRV